MQIRLNNVKYKNLNLNFNIMPEMITGIISSDIYDLYNINFIIENNTCDSGEIKYSKKYSKNRIMVITLNDVPNIVNGTINDYVNVKNIKEEYLSLLDIKDSFFEKEISYLSTSEKIKFLILQCIKANPDVIIAENILEELDSQTRKKIIKLLINLKKFDKKTIIVSSIDIDIIYEFIDNLIIIINNESIQSKDKYSIYDENGLIFYKPFIKEIEDMIFLKKNINLGNNDNINELLKAIYREIR